MPNPMPFALRLITLFILITLPATALADTPDLAPESRSAQERISLGLRIGMSSVPMSGLLGGLGLLGNLYNTEHMLTIGIPLGSSGWRIEPGVFASYATNDNFTSRSLSLSVMPQRIIAAHRHGSFYAGGALTYSQFNYTAQAMGQAGQATSSTRRFDAQPLLGVQGLIGNALGVGFEAGPLITHVPESSSELGGLGEVATIASTFITTRANLTIKYYF